MHYNEQFLTKLDALQLWALQLEAANLGPAYAAALAAQLERLDAYLRPL